MTSFITKTSQVVGLLEPENLPNPLNSHIVPSHHQPQRVLENKSFSFEPPVRRIIDKTA